jgi:hypothetical protein
MPDSFCEYEKFNEEIMPSVKSVSFAISILEHTIGMLEKDIDTTPFPSDFILEIVKVRQSIQYLRNLYINSLRFKF